jgi:hypothetical protein
MTSLLAASRVLDVTVVLDVTGVHLWVDTPRAANESPKHPLLEEFLSVRGLILMASR